MLARSPPAVVVVINTLEPPAVGRSILIDRAPAIFSQELTPPAHIRQRLLNHTSPAMLDHHIRGERPKATILRLLQQHRVLMPILPAAVGTTALAAGTLTNDRNTIPQKRPNASTLAAGSARRPGAPRHPLLRQAWPVPEEAAAAAAPSQSDRPSSAWQCCRPS